VTSWTDAIALLDAYPHWAEFYPLAVHPDFRKQVWEEVESRLHQAGSDQHNLDHWRRICEASRLATAKTSNGGTSMKLLGNLEKLDLRDYWEDEARDFTPWLAEESNLKLLAETIGVGELEMVDEEKPVGDFRADILARDSEGKYLVIENQLEPSDHKHLGQLLTYSSGLEAAYVVWVAPQIRDEHRKVIDWLNGAANSSVNFFALEIELWRIGDSAAAPKFNVVCRPNDWANTVKESQAVMEATPLQKLQSEFWSEFVEFCKQEKTFLSLRRPPAGHYYLLGLGKVGLKISLTVKAQKQILGCEVYIDHPRAKEVFDQLEAQKGEIEGQLGTTLQWQRLEGRGACRIAQFRSGDIYARDQWKEYFSWLKERAETFYKAFSARVKVLEIDGDENNQ
jgi:hypothetical protein